MEHRPLIFVKAIVLLCVIVSCFSACNLKTEFQKLVGTKVNNEQQIVNEPTEPLDQSNFFYLDDEVIDDGFHSSPPSIKVKISSANYYNLITDSHIQLKDFDTDIMQQYLNSENEIKEGYTLVVIELDITKTKDLPNNVVQNNLAANIFRLRAYDGTDINSTNSILTYFNVNETELVTRSSDVNGYYVFSVPEGSTAACKIGWIVPNEALQPNDLVVSLGFDINRQQYVFLNKK